MAGALKIRFGMRQGNAIPQTADAVGDQLSVVDRGSADGGFWDVAMVAVRQPAMESALASASSAPQVDEPLRSRTGRQPPAADPASALHAMYTEPA